MSHQRRGFALISTFLFLGMLFMMAVSMILMSRQRIYAGMSQHHQTQALYTAEAGLARAQVALENDIDWPGITDGTIDGMRGTYTVTFGNGKYDSVNNIGGLTSANSYRGAGTVPQNHALIIVNANVSGHRYTLEALVEGTASAGHMSDAILASGRIESKGDLHIDGISALDDAAEVDGSIQSNEPSGSNLVTWDGSGSAVITGAVGSGSPSSSAISMPGASILGGSELNSTAVIPNYDVGTEVDNNSGHSAMPSPSGGTVTLTGGDYSFGGGTISGDVVLKNDATLYISNDVTIQGTIRGSGSVWVKGTTKLKGDAEVTSHAEQTVSLYSKGSVVLTGFDGSEYLDDVLSGSSGLQQKLQDVEDAVAIVQDTVDGNPNMTDPAKLPHRYPGETVTNRIWDFSAVVGDHGFAQLINGTNRSNLLSDIKSHVDGLPAGETRDFVSRRLNKLNMAFGSYDDISGGLEEAEALNNYNSPAPDTTGIIDAVLTEAKYGNPAEMAIANDLWPETINIIKQVNYDKLGTSYFQGAIYTQGAFVANNEVQVLGAIIAEGHGNTPETFTLNRYPNSTFNVTVQPGDVYLGKRTRVTYVEEMFKDDALPNAGPKLLSKVLWMGR